MKLGCLSGLFRFLDKDTKMQNKNGMSIAAHLQASSLKGGAN